MWKTSESGDAGCTKPLKIVAAAMNVGRKMMVWVLLIVADSKISPTGERV